jgi:hypothetical protein
VERYDLIFAVLHHHSMIIFQIDEGTISFIFHFELAS